MKLARLSTSVRFQNRAEGGKGTESQKKHRKMYAGRGDTAHNFFDLGNNWGGEKNTYWEGGTPHTAHTLLMGRTIGVGTPHTLQTP